MAIVLAIGALIFFMMRRKSGPGGAVAPPVPPAVPTMAGSVPPPAPPPTNAAPNLTVQCGFCRSLVQISVSGFGGGSLQFQCPMCGKLNQFSISGALTEAKPAKDIVVEFPTYWKSRSLDAPSVFEHDSAAIKEGVQQMFDKTWKNQWTRDRGRGGKVSKFEVVTVQRNENPRKWAEYFRMREQLKAKVDSMGGTDLFEAKTASEIVGAADAPQAQEFLARAGLCKDVNEFYLFHGTKPSAAKSICESDFLVKKAGSNAGTLYGPGLYFAESSSKSDEYAVDDKDGIFAGLFGIIVCRVTCGVINYNDEVSPPVQDLVDSVLSRQTHHCILGDREKCRGTFREFIIFDNKQVYPEYVVIYKRVDE